MVSIQPTTMIPSVGDIAVMWYGHVKHLAVVTEVNGDNITIKEGNYRRCKETERTITTNYPHLTGFYD
jgi:surface antigen